VTDLDGGIELVVDNEYIMSQRIFVPLASSIKYSLLASVSSKLKVVAGVRNMLKRSSPVTVKQLIHCPKELILRKKLESG